MENIHASDEQGGVIKILSDGLNCFVNAVPGAGKSTLSYLISKHFENYNVLSLTYSANLKREARIKIKQFGITNLEIHSYHSFAISYYDEEFDDSVIERVVQENKKLNKTDKIDLLILDEIQDMTINIYNMVKKYISDCENKIQLLVIGDKDQAIFSFVDADHRFLTLANQIFPGDFVKAFLSRSYRLTDPVSQFINKCMLGEPKILTSKPGKNVQYVIGNPYFRDFKNYIYKCIKDKLKNGYSYEDIFILAPSVKGDKTPIKRLNQFLAQKKIDGKNIPIYINTNDEETLTDSNDNISSI
jgi:superfamily I DNA/RNA helicase